MPAQKSAAGFAILDVFLVRGQAAWRPFPGERQIPSLGQKSLVRIAGRAAGRWSSAESRDAALQGHGADVGNRPDSL